MDAGTRICIFDINPQYHERVPKNIVKIDENSKAIEIETRENLKSLNRC